MNYMNTTYFYLPIVGVTTRTSLHYVPRSTKEAYIHCLGKVMYLRNHVDHPGYWFSSCGQVISEAKGWLPKYVYLAENKQGDYYWVWLSKERKYLVHRLMLESFYRPRYPNEVCRHLDGNSKNNEISNLTWGTSKENHEDSVRHGTHHVGSASRNARLTESDVLTIRQRVEKGETYRNISKDYPVSEVTIRLIAMQKRWKHI